MTRPMKDLGMSELHQLQRRLRRQYAAKRIGQADFKFINERLDEIEARVVSMRELDEYGREC